MRSIRRAASVPTATPLTAEDLLEFHVARVLLLLHQCGVGKRRIVGLTKLAKLDFFVRYPKFFRRVAEPPRNASEGRGEAVESSMVRFKYGPWDPRYYQVLPYLEATGLVTVTRGARALRFELTDRGLDVATHLSGIRAYKPLVRHMKRVRDALGSKSGSELKSMIYQQFEAEVAAKRFGERIE